MNRAVVMRVAIIAAVTLLALFLGMEGSPSGSAWTILTFSLVGITTTVGLARSNAKQGVSLEVIFWFYHHLFFFAAPLAQYLSGSWTYPLEEWVIPVANLATLGFLGMFALAYGVTASAVDPIFVREAGMRTLQPIRILALSLGAFAILAGFAAIAGYSPARSPVIDVLGYRPAGQLLDFILRPLTFFASMFALYYARYGGRGSGLAYVGLSVVLAVGLLVNLPTGAARFYVFATYLAVAILLVPPAAWNRAIYLLLLAVGIPASYFLTLARQWVSGNVGSDPISPSIFLAQGHFDGFENFAHAIRFVAERGPVWGHQLLGVVFFWVPRAWWPAKPMGTGAFLVSEYVSPGATGASTNVSAPLLLEAYINFAWIGIFVGAALVGILAAWADSAFAGHLSWTREHRGARATPRFHLHAMVLYPVLVGMFLFILRGDLLSSTAYTAGFVAVFLLAERIVSRPSPGGV